MIPNKIEFSALYMFLGLFNGKGIKGTSLKLQAIINIKKQKV